MIYPKFSIFFEICHDKFLVLENVLDNRSKSTYNEDELLSREWGYAKCEAYSTTYMNIIRSAGHLSGCCPQTVLYGELCYKRR